MADLTGVSDNSIATLSPQRTINSGFGTQVFQNTATDNSYSLDPTDTQDFFRLRLSRRSSVIVTLNNLTANANLELYDSGGVLQSSTNGGTLAEALTTEALDAGDYYIRVSLPDTSVSTNYTLGVNTINAARADLVWRNYATGQNAIWLMNGTSLGTALLSTTVSDPNWFIEATGDMDGDGVPDIIWRNVASGQNAVWVMDGTTIRSVQFLASVGGPWSIEGATDVDADGKTDLIWRNYSTGQNAIWFMNGFSLRTSAFIPSQPGGTNVQINAVGDFNGDNKPDLVWRNYTTGQNFVWMMDGTTLLSNVTIDQSIPDPNWRLSGTGDFNGDGKLDLVWRNQVSGQNAVWYMNGTTYSTVAFFNSITDVNWRIGSVINAPPVVDLAGNTLGTAFNVGALNSTGLYSDTIGGAADRDDYYRFTLNAATVLNLTLSGLSADADLQLIRDANSNGFIDAGEVIRTSANNDLSNEAIANESLTAGTYFIRVFSSAPQRTPYILNIGGAAAQQIDLLVPTTIPPALPAFRLTTTSNATLPTSVNIGSAQTVRVNYQVRNNSPGNVTPAQFRVSFYLSRDSVITSSDRLLGNIDPVTGFSDRDVIITNLAPSATQSGTQDITLPAATDAYWGGNQTYYIGMIIDSASQVAETSETNNTAAAPINITGTLSPDIVGNGLNVTQISAQPGQAIQVTGSIRNIGTVSTGANQRFFVRFYFSNDDIIDESDFTFDGLASITTIAAGGTVNFDSSIGQPTTGPDPAAFFTVTPLVLPDRLWDGWRGNGRYYVGMELNILGIVSESDGARENNRNYGRTVGSFLDYDFIDITGL